MKRLAKITIGFFLIIAPLISTAQVSFTRIDSLNKINYSIVNTTSGFLFGDFDGDDLKDTCIAIKTNKGSQYKGVLFIFGNGSRVTIGANSKTPVKEMIDENPAKEKQLGDIAFHNWKVYNSETINNTHPSALDKIVAGNRTKYKITKGDVLLLDFGNVYYLLCKTNNTWLFINLGV